MEESERWSDGDEEPSKKGVKKGRKEGKSEGVGDRRKRVTGINTGKGIED